MDLSLTCSRPAVSIHGENRTQNQIPIFADRNGDDRLDVERKSVAVMRRAVPEIFVAWNGMLISGEIRLASLSASFGSKPSTDIASAARDW